ncbi:DNA-binding protein [Bacilli bacterium]|nr:DNA-binding protein [Bacilli bacterium]
MNNNNYNLSKNHLYDEFVGDSEVSTESVHLGTCGAEQRIDDKIRSRNDFLIDSHCHIKLLNDQGKNVDDVIKNANENNVKLLINVCTRIDEMPAMLDISANHENVFCSVGQHPEEIKNEKIIIEDILRYVDNNKVVAIGETGLDYHYNIDNKANQTENFILHIEASRQGNLPIIIHSRDADEDMINILKSEVKNGAFNFVLHCFCSSRELAWTGLDLGGFISFSGILTFKNSTELKSIAKAVPLDRIILETDSPYLAPEPFRGKVNEPANVKYVAEYLSTLLDIDYETIQDKTTTNVFSLFSKLPNN